MTLSSFRVIKKNLDLYLLFRLLGFPLKFPYVNFCILILPKKKTLLEPKFMHERTHNVENQ